MPWPMSYKSALEYIRASRAKRAARILSPHRGVGGDGRTAKRRLPSYRERG